MQCSCGGDATTKPATKKLSKTLIAKLSFYECEKCSRVSGAVLFITDTVVAEDNGGVAEARQAFNNLTIESAESLLRDAIKALPPAVLAPAPVTQATQAAFEF